MRYGKTGTIAAAVVLALGLAAHADEEQERRSAEDAPKAAAREGGERERRGDEEAAERQRRRDRDARDRERRRDEDAERDEGRRGPRERGPMRREERREGGMPGGPGMMGGPPGPVRGMMRGMMMGRDGMPPGMPGMHPEEAMRRGMHPDEAMRREVDPEMFELEENDHRLEHESHQLAEHYRHAPEGPAREEIRGKLQEVVSRHFKVRQERRELEVKRLEAQLDRLRGALEKRSKDADAIIDQRMSQLLGAEDFGF